MLDHYSYTESEWQEPKLHRFQPRKWLVCLLAIVCLPVMGLVGAAGSAQAASNYLSPSRCWHGPNVLGMQIMQLCVNANIVKQEPGNTTVWWGTVWATASSTGYNITNKTAQWDYKSAHYSVDRANATYVFGVNTSWITFNMWSYDAQVTQSMA